MNLAHAMAVHDHLGADGVAAVITAHHHTGEVYPRNHRPFPDDGTFTGDSQGVLIVQRGIRDSYLHFASWQVAIFLLENSRLGGPALFFAQYKGFEHVTAPIKLKIDAPR